MYSSSTSGNVFFLTLIIIIIIGWKIIGTVEIGDSETCGFQSVSCFFHYNGAFGYFAKTADHTNI